MSLNLTFDVPNPLDSQHPYIDFNLTMPSHRHCRDFPAMPNFPGLPDLPGRSQPAGLQLRPACF
ncbi:MAG UNVERIFIED_CONTAM: hypothetical protein LVR18_02965 [Planctomycetaceae bacterium]